MNRLQLMILLVFLGATSVWAQDDEPEPGQAEEAETPESVEPPLTEITDEEIEQLLGLDEDYTEVEDDDFEATEQVRFAQSIPFPTDI